MGRKSKLSEKEWTDVDRRLLVGESARAIAREYGVGEATIRARKSAHTQPIKDVANQLVSAQTALNRLPISAQQSAQTLAQKLMSISFHATDAAENGMAIAHRLSGIGRMLVEQVDDANPLQSMEQIKAVAALTDVANKAASVGLNLLAANRGSIPAEPPKPPSVLPADILDAAAEYARIMG